jgi:hypothetical protein
MTFGAKMVTMNGRATVDSGSGKDRISGGDTVNANHRSTVGRSGLEFGFGLGTGAATLTGGSDTGPVVSKTIEAIPTVHLQHMPGPTITLGDDTTISFIDVASLISIAPFAQISLG